LKNHIPVNQFSDKKEMEIYGLLSWSPIFIAGTVTFILIYYEYYYCGIFAGILTFILGILFTATNLHSNARIYIQPNGLLVKKRKSETFFQWSDIKEFVFKDTMAEGLDTVQHPIRLVIVYETEQKQEELSLLLCKHWFRTPTFLYYKLLSLIGTIPEARHLLPERLLEKTS